jgi:hypothetical protein
VISQEHALRALFHELVDNCYRGDLRMDDAEISSYMADLLTDFSESEKIYAIRDSIGRPVKELDEMLEAADPVHGTAASFDAERQARKHIGDYALFFTGMYPEAMQPALQPHSFMRLIETGKESYQIVASFDLFEYAREAPLFERLAEQFETCVSGLNLVRAELDKRRALPFSRTPQRHLM